MSKKDTVLYENKNVQDYIGRQPSWFVRWGITSIITLFILLLITSRITHLGQETVYSLDNIRTSAPNNISFPLELSIDSMFVELGDRVSKGDPLFRINPNKVLNHIGITTGHLTPQYKHQLLNEIILFLGSENQLEDAIFYSPSNGSIMFNKEFSIYREFNSGHELVQIIDEPDSLIGQVVLEAEYAKPFLEETKQNLSLLVHNEENQTSFSGKIIATKKTRDNKFLILITFPKPAMWVDSKTDMTFTLHLDGFQRTYFSELFTRGW